MKRELIKILPYDKVQFKFISDHHDVNLNGSCLFEHSICEFETHPTDYDETDDVDMVSIYKLNWLSQLNWIWKQWLFEKCVGYHWSYKNQKKIKNFYYRKPKWFYMWLLKLYYGLL